MTAANPDEALEFTVTLTDADVLDAYETTASDYRRRMLDLRKQSRKSRRLSVKIAITHALGLLVVLVLATVIHASLQMKDRYWLLIWIPFLMWLAAWAVFAPACNFFYRRYFWRRLVKATRRLLSDVGEVANFAVRSEAVTATFSDRSNTIRRTPESYVMEKPGQFFFFAGDSYLSIRKEVWNSRSSQQFAGSRAIGGTRFQRVRVTFGCRLWRGSSQPGCSLR